MSGVIADLLKTIRPEFNFEQSSDFIGDGLLDSLDIVTLVSSLDEKYSISIDGVEIVPENFCSIQAIEALLAKHGVQP